MKKLVLSLAFAAVGTFAMAQQQPQQKMPSKWGEEHQQMMEQKKAQRMAEMQKDLNLTQAQVAQIKALHEKNQAKRTQERMQNQELRKQKMEAFKKDRQQMDDEMRRILTPEQYQKWQAKKQEQMKNRKDKMGKDFRGKGKGFHKGFDKNQKTMGQPIQK